MGAMNDDEAMLVATVREFVDKDVRPTVREVEHANEYPEAWIEQMKRIGIYGLAVPRSTAARRCRCRATCWSPRSWRAAG